MKTFRIFDEKIYKEKYNKYKKKYLITRNQIHKNTELIGGGKNIWIEDDFFDSNKFDKIHSYSMDLINNLNKDSRVSERQTLCLNHKKYSELYDIIYDDPKFKEFIKKISPLKMRSRPSFPIELRKYPTGSKGMKWHRDLSLFNPDCYEIVLTLENTSDSKFEYGVINKKTKETKPNTLTIVKPNGVIHKVTPVNYGHRIILKFIVEFLDENGKIAKTKDAFKKEIDKCPY